MKWQALNPLRMVGQTVRVWQAVRPQVTKRRLIAVAASGLVGSAGVATHQLWHAGSSAKTDSQVVALSEPTSELPVESSVASSAADQRIEGMLANPISPIPDPGEPDVDQAYAPVPRRVIAGEMTTDDQPPTGSEVAGSEVAGSEVAGSDAPGNEPPGGDPATFNAPGAGFAGPRLTAPSTEPDLAGPEGTEEVATPSDNVAGRGGFAPAAPRGLGRPPVTNPGVNSFAQPVAAETESPATPSAAPGSGLNPAAAPENPEPPITIPSPPPASDPSNPASALPALPAAPTGAPTLPVPPPGTAANPSGPGMTAAANPANSAGTGNPAAGPTGVPVDPRSAPAELVPVDPSRLQPDPAEQIRVPEEAAPSLSPSTLPPAARSLGNSNLTPSGDSAGGLPGAPAGEANVPEVPATRGLDAPPPADASLPASRSAPSDDAARQLPAVGQPGAKHLEGVQTPTLSIEKIAPGEIQVGQPATFGVRVRNTGRVVAQQVMIHDQIPRGTRLAETMPAATRAADGTLQWQVGALEPGQEALVSLKVIPEQEGEIGSVAQVTFQSLASVRTIATRPQITIEHVAPAKVLIGQPIAIQLTITNHGTGTARNLLLEEAVPAGLTHPAGPELEYPVGNLRPQESKRIELTLKGVKPGNYQNVIVARTDAAQLAEARVPVEVQAPRMVVNVTGPKVRYLDRQATYSVSVANPGTAPATNLEVVAQLPRGLKFVSADHQGQYDPQRHAVAWGLAELPPGVAGTSQVVVVPVEPGEQRLRVTGRGDLNLEHAHEQAVVVETLSELQFAVADTADPIEVGSETTYDLRVMNRGSRTASNIQLAIDFPPELEPLSGDGPSRVQVRGGQLSIEPLAKLAPNAQVAYQIKVKGLRAGDPRIRVRLTCDEAPTPVSKEESTRVYADNE